MALRAFAAMDPETAHDASLRLLRAGLVPAPGPVTDPSLTVTLAGMTLPNPVGLAAGYDKNAVALAPLMRAGFGFLEVGAATPRPQPGNPRPRLFRLPEDGAVLNRFGFNNEGMDAIGARLGARPAGVPVGLNLGANKDSADRAADYARVLRTAGRRADFVTVNVSSPNTEGLRALQGGPLRSLLRDVMGARDEAGAMAGPRVFLKIAPDLEADQIDEIAGIATEAELDGIVATNTTLARDGLRSRHRAEAGGLSGRPLFERSTRVLARLSRETDLPLIGVGGVATPEDALAKIEAGATAVQLYSAMTTGGLSLARRLPEGLAALLAARGLTAAAAVGTGRDAWL